MIEQIDEVAVFIGRTLPRGLIKAISIAGSAGKCKKTANHSRHDINDKDNEHERDDYKKR